MAAFLHIRKSLCRTSQPTLDIPALGNENTAFKVLGAIGFSHFLNDMIQSLLPAIYPLLKSSFSLSFTQIGLITLTFQITASLLQPMVGLYTDHHPKPYSLSIGMGCTLAGLIILAFAPGYGILLIAAAMVGTGSSIFHPESSRVARMASGGRYGLAQSIFQVVATAAVQRVRCWLPLSSSRMAETVSPGSHWLRFSPCWCCGRSAAGTRASNRERSGPASLRSRSRRSLPVR